MTPPTVVNISTGYPKGRWLYIGRANRAHDLKASKWANPHKIACDADRPAALDRYKADTLGNRDLMAALPELAGQTIGCWCHPKPCHGHVLQALFREFVLNEKPALVADEWPANGTPVECLRFHLCGRAGVKYRFTDAQAVEHLRELKLITSGAKGWGDVTDTEARRALDWYCDLVRGKNPPLPT